MTAEPSDEIAELLRIAAKEPLIPETQRGRETVIDREGIQAVLPHRDPFLLVDRVTMLDLQAGLAVGYYDLSRARDVFAGHFPGNPVWPGVLQVEAMGQVGLIPYLQQAEGSPLLNVSLTHILAARFIRPVRPNGQVEILARAFEDGIFLTIVGQCLQDGFICSTAATRVICDF